MVSQWVAVTRARPQPKDPKKPMNRLIYLEVAVPGAELELVDELLVLHHVQRVEHVHVQVPREDEGVAHEILERHGGGHVVEGVDRLEQLVLLVADHRGGEVIEARRGSG